MAASSGNTEVFDCQVKACEEFFQKPLPKVQNLKPLEKDDIPENAKRFEGPIYDITRFDAREVVALLSRIVNDREHFKMNQTFYLLLRNGQENKPDEIYQELFKLKARPTKHQPGNAMVFLCPRETKRTEPAKKYDELNGALKAYYEADTASFARDIRELFKNNAVANNSFPQAKFEVYMILLFEVARRLVELEEPSEKKEQFDVLPIGSAIARIVKLLELGIKDTCTFEDVFLPKSKFHCFTGKPEDRRKAIDKINETTLDKLVPPAIVPAEVKPSTSAGTLPFLEELKEMFCSEKQPEAMLQKGLEDLSISVSVADSKALSMKTKKSAVNTEEFSAFDHV